MTKNLRITTPILDIACRESGPADGPIAILLHGFPYSARGYDDAAAILADAGCRVLVPDLRGYGGTRFLSDETVRSGEQAALAHDVVEMMDALKIERAVLGGYDWGGRAACIVAALWPERVQGLVSCQGYTIQDIAASAQPLDPAIEARLWYQYYFHLERGRHGLAQNRRAIARLLWTQWSPSWAFDDATFARSADAFDNDDFVDVSIHAYRHRYGNVPGDPAYAATEAKLALRPAITVPGTCLQGADDNVTLASDSEAHARFFTGHYERRLLAGIGHNPPQEAPRAFADAMIELCQAASS